jgi:hypothetical protein
MRPNGVRTPEQWNAGDHAISRRVSPPVFFFRVARVVPAYDADDPWPVLVAARCCARCEELGELVGRGWSSFWFRHATAREIRELSAVSACPFRNLPHAPRVGACTRALGLSASPSSSSSRAASRRRARRSRRSPRGRT